MTTTYPYLGDQVLTYPGYRDEATERMLTAEPGGSYAIVAADESAPDADGNRLPLPVPPTDGRWGEPPAAVVVKPQKAAKTVKESADEGDDA